MEVKLKATSQVVKKAEYLNLYLEKSGFDIEASRLHPDEGGKPISCRKEVEIDDAERVTEYLIYTQ